MSLKDLEPGIYQAFPVSWGVVEVEHLPNKPLAASIEFDLCDHPGSKIEWSEFFLKRDGSYNKKTLKTLKACGFQSSDLADFVNPDSLTTDMPVLLTLAKDDNGYLKVEWVNSPQGGTRGDYVEAKEAKKLLKSLNLNQALAELVEKKQATPVPKPSHKPKNYAPGAPPPPAPSPSDVDDWLKGM